MGDIERAHVAALHAINSHIFGRVVEIGGFTAERGGLDPAGIVSTLAGSKQL